MDAGAKNGVGAIQEGGEGLMGLFSKRQPEPPVRRDQVLNLIKLGMKETDEAERDIDSKRFEHARDEYDRAMKNATPAERKAAIEAKRRHGY